jgi:hypothetical protein
MMMILSVDHYDRPQSAGSQTIDVLHRKAAIFRDAPGFHLELGAGLVEQKLCLPYVARGARADGEQVIASGIERKGFVERRDPIHFDERYSQLSGNHYHRIFRDVPELFLYILEHLDEEVGLAATSL